MTADNPVRFAQISSSPLFDTAQTVPMRTPDHHWVSQVSRQAMATEFVVMLGPRHAAAMERAVTALELVEQIENRLSVYRSDSEIAEINRSAASTPVRVSSETFFVLEKAIEWSQRTQGRFDITAGPLVKTWGFHDRRGRKPSTEEVTEALERVGYQKLRLDPERRTVAFDRPGMSINLGGIGKGYAIDQVAERLLEANITDFLIHGGNSSLLARGSQSPEHDRGWAVGIAHPTRAGNRLAGVWLKDAALGTSGSGKQFFHHRGRRIGHVIDPRSGYPETDLLALSLRTTRALDADAGGTGLFLAGTPNISSCKLSDLHIATLAVHPGDRDREVRVTAQGDWDWVEPPEVKSESNQAG